MKESPPTPPSQNPPCPFESSPRPDYIVCRGAVGTCPCLLARGSWLYMALIEGGGLSPTYNHHTLLVR